MRDGGIRGVVVHPSGGEFDKIECQGIEVTAGVGAKLKQIAYAGKAAGIGGFEWMEGIPGEVGGALRMNAGAMGAQTFDQVVQRALSRSRRVPTRRRRRDGRCTIATCPTLEENFAVSAVFRGEDRRRRRSLGDWMNRRRNAAPPNRARRAPAAFSKIRSIPAGKLVDELGLKGSRVGDARVSEVHGNFIVNEGAATAADRCSELIEQDPGNARERSAASNCETEVQIVGEEAMKAMIDLSTGKKSPCSKAARVPSAKFRSRPAPASPRRCVRSARK